MGFFEAVGVSFRKYATFSGRARRSEFWWWQLLCVLLNVSPFILAVLGYLAAPSAVDWLVWVGYAINAAILIPDMAITCRRLHDIERSGWWQVLFLVPIVGWVLFVWWCVKPGDAGPNRFGPSPVGSGIGADASFVDGAGA